MYGIYIMARETVANFGGVFSNLKVYRYNNNNMTSIDKDSVVKRAFHVDESTTTILSYTQALTWPFVFFKLRFIKVDRYLQSYSTLAVRTYLGTKRP